MNLVETGIGTTGEETIKLVIIINKFNDGINERPKVRLPLQGEVDTGPRSLVLCGYPS
jgi:hypothetical protein